MTLPTSIGTHPQPAGPTDAILQARRTSDIEQRGTLYKQAVPLIMEDSPSILLFNSPDRFTGSASRSSP